MASIEDVLHKNREKIASVTPFDFKSVKIFTFDFSSGNKDLENIDITSASDRDAWIKKTLKLNGAKVGIGRYGEDRVIYRHRKIFKSDGSEERSIHLGMDVYLPAGTPVFSPLKSTIHSLKNNSASGDYGPTIILKHEMDGLVFYTLYGHLSLESLENKKEGDVFDAGEKIGEIGNIKVNGNWPDHLHFQLIKDMGNFKGDFPGVSSRSDSENYFKICPNPKTILRLE